MSDSGPFSFPEMERTVLAFWEESGIFQQSLERTKGGKPYIFYDGPPFATGLPHHGHLLVSALKDAVARYWTMKGRFVERRFGWDCHGLPVEHEIDKKLGMHALDAVKKLGVKGYNDECRKIVLRYTSEWRKTIGRLGRWVDFDNDYKTMDASFMESVWWVFRQLWDKDLIYQGVRVVPFSTALGTVLSNFEAGQNYQQTQDPSITVLFKLQDEDAFLAAWTTTPWTLPSNLALCVGKDIDYVLTRSEKTGKNIYLARAALARYQKKHRLTVSRELKGADLRGRRYEPLFGFFGHFAKDGGFTVLGDDFVTTEAGTGIVHIAPGFGEDDNRVMRQACLANVFACPVDNQGRFTDEVADWAGVGVKEADKGIIAALKGSGALLEQATLVHSYPFCWRSDTPLIYKAIPSWYVRVESLRQRLLAANEQIHWVPEHIKNGRFGKWLEQARDWAISRNRVWGTPLPIWHNSANDKFLCIGSIAELAKLSGVNLQDLHREHVDDLSFTVPGEPGEYRRIPEVLDCWFESGSMPYAQLHYPFEGQDMFAKGFPAEFIVESLDQTRGWFYTLLILSTALHDKPPFNNVIVSGMISAADGKKMSKRLKNYTPPDTLMEHDGADAFRLYMINSPLVRGLEMRFSDDGVKDMVRRTLLPWYNAWKFFATYAAVDNWTYSSSVQPGDNILDKWIISKLQTLKGDISREMEAYRLYNVVGPLLDFIEDLTNWYIRLNRGRFWGEGDGADKNAAYATLYTCIRELCLSMAPFTPFLSEHIYRELAKFSKEQAEESVHLCPYPTAQADCIDTQLEQAVDRMQQIILLGRQGRNEAKIKVKTPLSKLVCIHRDRDLLAGIGRLAGYIKSELNVKEVACTSKEDKFVRLRAKPNLPVLGKRLGKRLGTFVPLIKGLAGQELARIEAGETVFLEGEEFGQEDLLILREAKKGTSTLSNRHVAIELDCTLTDELIREGLAREVVNRIQKTRKELNLHVADRIRVSFCAEAPLRKAILSHQEYIREETLAVSLTEATGAADHHFQIEGHGLKMDIVRV